MTLGHIFIRVLKFLYESYHSINIYTHLSLTMYQYNVYIVTANIDTQKCRDMNLAQEMTFLGGNVSRCVCT